MLVAGGLDNTGDPNLQARNSAIQRAEPGRPPAAWAPHDIVRRPYCYVTAGAGRRRSRYQRHPNRECRTLRSGERNLVATGSPGAGGFTLPRRCCRTARWLVAGGASTRAPQSRARNYDPAERDLIAHRQPWHLHATARRRTLLPDSRGARRRWSGQHRHPNCQRGTLRSG